MTTYAVIMNKKAGTAGSKQREAISEAFTHHGVSFKLIQPQGDLVVAATTAARTHDVLVAAGGDGTVGAVATAAVAAGKPLGVIAAGTLNHFAKDAGLPLDIPTAVAAIVSGASMPIDYATAGDRLFLNNASVGIYPKLVRRREQRQKRLGKWPALAQELIALIRRPLRRRKIHITYSGKTHSVSTPFIFIGNNNYHTPESGLGARTRLNGGRLTVFIYTQTSWLRFGLELLKAFRGQATQAALLTAHPQSLTLNTSSATIELATDGEVSRQPLPLTVAIHPEALELRIAKA